MCLKSLNKHPSSMGRGCSQLLEQPDETVKTVSLGSSDVIGSNVKIIGGFCIPPVESV